jgi:hypothetical protein
MLLNTSYLHGGRYQMAQIPIRTARKRDADVIEAFQRIDSTVGGQGNNWSLTVFIGAQSGNPQINGPWEAVKEQPGVQSLLKENGSLAGFFNASFPGMPSLSITLVRNFADNFDLVTAHIPDNQPAPIITSLMKRLETEFPTFASGAVVEQLLGKEFADFYRARDLSVGRIENSLTKLIEDADVYRRKLDDRFDEKRAELETGVAQARARLEEEAAARNAAMNEAGEALKTREKELDDRSARHARRALHLALQTQLKAHSTSFALTEGTAEKRRLIHGIFGLALAFDALITCFTLWEGRTTLDALPTIVRLLAGVVGFAVIVILYIRWADQWFRQHADEEFRLKRMSLDVDRASWVVETAMEWEQQNKGPIPEQLLEDLTRGLFMPAAGSPAVRHPVEDLASAVLGASSNLEFEIPGLGKGMLSRRGIKRAMAAARQD